MKHLLMVAACVLVLAGCKARPGQNTYGAGEIGTSRAVEFGTVLSVREVDIVGENSGAGTLLGAGLGAGGGSYVGKGDGNAWATVGAALVGAVAGHYAEQAINDRKGWEYAVRLQSGETKLIIQEQIEGDVKFKPGAHVMLPYCDAGEYNRKCPGGKGVYQRLLPVDALPPYGKKAKAKHKRRKHAREDIEVLDDATTDERTN